MGRPHRAKHFIKLQKYDPLFKTYLTVSFFKDWRGGGVKLNKLGREN